MSKEATPVNLPRRWPTVLTADGSFDLLDESDKQILIVDDEESVRTLFAGCLSERYPCSTAATAEEALTQLASTPYALVITDVLMPGRSGTELLREIVTRFPDTAVIMASGIDRTQRILDAIRLGAFDYIIKPCDMGLLERCVERALERRSLLQTARTYKQNLEQQNRELASRKAALERLQAQIIHNEKMASLGQLAAGIAHELNNPAGYIYGNMDMLRECAERIKTLFAFYDALTLAPEIAAQAASLKADLDYENLLLDLPTIITDCGDGSQRICDVVQNLRTFSRLDEAEFKKIDLHEGIESTVRLLSRYYNSGHVVLRRDYGDLPPVSCYAGQLNQVWMNLLVNAAQAVSGDGEVCITTRAEDDVVHVRVSDNGCGIALEEQRKIFDPFFTTKPVGEGTGLGLSITYGIIERHGGSIRVESEKGQGTCFYITIPVEAGHTGTAAV